jgi:multidrug efflux pump subunit AcrA (membrane-fusion protein)
VSQGTTIEQQPEQKQGGEQGGRPSGNRSQLVQRLLDHSVNLPAFVHDLLQTQAVTVAGTEAAAFLLERGEQGTTFRPIAHIRPDQSTPEIRAAAIQAFQDIVKPCVEQGKDGAIEVSGGNDAHEAQYCLVTLLRSEGELVAVSAVITRCRDLERARQRLQSMLLVAGYFDVYALRRSSDQARMVAQAHQQVLQLATSVATATGFQSAANNLCNELATRSSATRVSIGWLKGTRIRVKALSHTEQFDKKQELIVDLERAMEECYDQEAVVQYDPAGKSSDNVTRSHQALSRSQGGHAVLSLPLRHKDEIIGVVTLEFLPNQQLGPQVASGLAVAVELLAPQLWDRYNNDRWLITKAGISTRETAKMVIGPKHMVAKLVTFLVVVAVLIICNIPHQLYPKSWPGSAYLDMRPTYRVSAPFEFVPTERRILNAPFAGELESVNTLNGELVRPGAVVKKGDILAYMRRDHLVMELADYRAQAAQARLNATRFRNDEDPTNDAQGLVAEAEEAAALAKVGGLEYQMEQAIIRSPIDGIVLEGDQVDKQGSKVEPNNVLFEIGELTSLKVQISVNERDMQMVQVHQKGELATQSLPTEKFSFVVERVVPMGDSKEGANSFRVYAIPDKSDPNWRPGLEGEARLEFGKKTWAWIWTHRLVDWVRLQVWM